MDFIDKRVDDDFSDLTKYLGYRAWSNTINVPYGNTHSALALGRLEHLHRSVYYLSRHSWIS